MRIAFLVNSFPCISETFILDQITGLIDLGCEVEIFAWRSGTPGATHPEVAAYGLMDRRHTTCSPANFALRPWQAMRLAIHATSLRLFFETLAWSGRPGFDVIHCHFGPNGVQGLALRDIGAMRGKLVTSFYGYDVSEFPRRHRSNPYSQLFAQGDLFLAISDEMRRKLIELGCDSKRIVVQHLGVNPQRFACARPSDSGRPIRILSIARMVPKKGLEYALKAVAALVKEEPNVEYVIIGDGPLRRKIESLVQSLGVTGVVRLAGWLPRPEIIRALADSDVLLAPSVTAESGDQEGTPVVIMEALASGVPVVSTRHAGIPEVVEDGISGFLVEERDVPALTLALQRLIRSRELRASMGARGRRAMEEQHDIGKLNDRLLGIYRGIQFSGGDKSDNLGDHRSDQIQRALPG